MPPTKTIIKIIARYQKEKKKSSSEIASETLSPEDIYRIVRPKYLFIE